MTHPLCHSPGRHWSKLCVGLTRSSVLYVHPAAPQPEVLAGRLAAVAIGAAGPSPRPKLVTLVVLVTLKPCPTTLTPNINKQIAATLGCLIKGVQQVWFVDWPAGAACNGGGVLCTGMAWCAAPLHKGRRVQQTPLARQKHDSAAWLHCGKGFGSQLGLADARESLIRGLCCLVLCLTSSCSSRAATPAEATLLDYSMHISLIEPVARATKQRQQLTLSAEDAQHPQQDQTL